MSGIFEVRVAFKIFPFEPSHVHEHFLPGWLTGEG
jgi:hypothetical protein